MTAELCTAMVPGSSNALSRCARDAAVNNAGFGSWWRNYSESGRLWRPRTRIGCSGYHSVVEIFLMSLSIESRFSNISLFNGQIMGSDLTIGTHIARS